MAQTYEFNLQDYWNIFLKRRTVILVSFLSVFLSIFIYTNFQTPIYRATVLIKIDPYLGIPSEIVFPNAARSYASQKDNLSDYTKQITSRPILEAAAKDLGMIKDDMNYRAKNLILANMSSTITADELEKTNMVRLSVQSNDPDTAANLANRIATEFKKINAEQRNQQAYNVRVFIEKTLTDVSRKLKEQDARLRDLTTRGAVGSGVNIVAQIYELEQKRAELLTKFTERHPDVLRLTEQVTELKNNLQKLPKEEFQYGILKRDITINESLYTMLKQKLPEAQIKEAERVDNVLIINPAIPPREPFYPDKKKNAVAGLILGLVLGISSALIIEHIDTSIGRVEDIENFIKVSVLGVIPYCEKKEPQDGKKEAKKRRWFKLPFGKKKSDAPIIYERPGSVLEQNTSSVFSEAFLILGVNLQVLFGKGEKINHKMILITSCNPEEGKTFTTSNLGVTLSQMGYKTLIIDADTRRSTVHKVFGMKHKEGGLLDVLTGKMPIESAIRTATDLMLGLSDADKVMDKPWLNNLNILTAGAVFPNPINLFNSKSMDDLMVYLRNKYDVVLVDTSPVLAVSEPSIIIPKMDGVLLVYKAGHTSRLALRRAKIQIESVKGKGGLSGVVLNNVTPEIGIDTYYYYYNKNYYGQKEAEKILEVGKTRKGDGKNV